MITYDGPINILLVDDHPDNLLALEAVLGDLNYNLVKCLSGEEALRCLLKDDFAVIVLDVQMPGMDGFETARLIKSREKTKEIPIIFITATSKESEHLYTGYAVGAIDYMLKPFVPQILRTKIEGFVNLYISNKKLQLQTELLHQKTVELERINSELMQTSYQLSKTESQARVIMETSIDTMITFDEDGIMLTVNPAVERMFGYSADEVVGTEASRLVPCLARLDFRKSAAAPTGKSCLGRLIEAQPIRKDGSTFDAEIQIGRELVDNEQIYACTISDVTERKLFEKELMEAKDAAEIAARAKTEFLAMVSHEIRTPMNGVIGMTALLMETDMSEEQQEYAEIIFKSGEALLSVINDILDYSKIESGKMELEEVPFQLASTIGETFDLFTAKSKKRNLEMSYSIDPQLDEPIVSDVTKLRQVLINLVGNAVKFTNEGSVHVSARLLEDYGTAMDIEFAVKDTGVGIPEEKLPLLFQPFSQLDSSMTRKYGGTGLGLAICKNLIELMGGSIRVLTDQEQGATFVFQIRAKRLAGYSADAGESTDAGAGGAAGEASGSEGDRPVSFSEFLAAMEETGAAAETRSPVPAPREAWWRETPQDAEPYGAGGGFGAAADVAEASAPLLWPAQAGAAAGEAGEAMSAGEPVLLLDEDPFRPMILVAEDNEVNQKLALRMLSKLGFAADVAENGAEVLKRLEKKRYRLVLMDIQMPVMDGIEATQRIMDTLPPERRPQVVAMTANVLPGDKEKCLEAGMTEFISKPIRLETLRQMLVRFQLYGVDAGDEMPDSLASDGAAFR